MMGKKKRQIRGEEETGVSRGRDDVKTVPPPPRCLIRRSCPRRTEKYGTTTTTTMTTTTTTTADLNQWGDASSPDTGLRKLYHVGSRSRLLHCEDESGRGLISNPAALLGGDGGDGGPDDDNDKGPDEDKKGPDDGNSMGRKKGKVKGRRGGRRSRAEATELAPSSALTFWYSDHLSDPPILRTR